jgi:hypothetical protein
MADLLAAQSVTSAAEMIELSGRLVRAQHEQQHAPLGRLRAQSGCFLLFCATILEVFTDDLTEEHLLDAHLENLATVRQQMAIDPQVAWRLLVTFRKSHGFEPPEFGDLG